MKTVVKSPREQLKSHQTDDASEDVGSHVLRSGFKTIFTKNRDKNEISQDGERLYIKEQHLLPISIFRLLCFSIWSGGIIYCTYHIYCAAEELLPWQKDPIMNPGILANILNRGRDNTDFEWVMFSNLLFTKLIFLYIFYLCITSLLGSKHQQISAIISPIFSFSLMTQLMGFVPTMYLFAQPIIYWFILRFRSRILIWLSTVFFLFSLNTRLLRIVVGHNGDAQYYFAISAAWNYARCVSFSFDSWDRPKNQSSSLYSLFSIVSYCFYFPLAVTGPIILFDQYERHILQKQHTTKDTSSMQNNLQILLKNIFRMLLIALLNEFILHTIYFRPLSLTIPALFELNHWALCGIVYWLGQFFTLKYKVMYGIPTFVSEFDGLKMPPLPRCPAYLHRYSVLWKDFDRGLYYFLVRYTYLPSLQFMNTVDKNRVIHPEIRKLIASFASFTYVYIWHSTSFEVLVWSALNFLGITIERIGSFLKRHFDSTWQVPFSPIIWDFIIEPIVTVPLAGMSILNSSVFCGSLDTATAVAQRLWTEKDQNYSYIFLFAFTHLAVTLRTWDQFYPQIKTKLFGVPGNLSK